MPELPEVQTVVSELNCKLKNRIIKTVVVNAPKIVSVGPATMLSKRKTQRIVADQFKKFMIGRKVLSVKRRAKLLIFNLSFPIKRYFGKEGGEKKELRLIAHLKMTGQFIFEDKVLREKTKGRYRIFNKPKAPLVQMPCKHTHIIFGFNDGSKLYFNDVRKFGYLKLIRDDEINQIKELKEFGPEPLGKKFTFLVFLKVLNKRGNAKIKQVLMDQKVLAGIGNIYSDEILFHSKVNPERKILSLSKKELKAIHKSIKKVLKIAIKAKGSSVGDFIRTDGSWGDMGKHHFVYGRSGLFCKYCGFIIQSIKLGGRTASFCPHCQK